MTRCIRAMVCAALSVLALGGVAEAQVGGGTATEPWHWYAEGVAQSAFGNVTSQSYGAEVGVKLGGSVAIFVEGGDTLNVATSDLSTSAQAIAGFLSQGMSGVNYSAREPVMFVDGGVKYWLPTMMRVQPYVLAGFGVGQLKRDVHFTLNGVDITNTISQYGVVLGSDLSGTSSEPLLTLGGGIDWPVWQRVVIDLQYRYGRIFLSGAGINVNRVGAGFGVRF